MRYRHTLNNRDVLIVGDSMARQLFLTVVGRLRGQSAIFDLQFFNATYLQPSLSQPDQLTVGALRSLPADLQDGAARICYTASNCFEDASAKDLPKLIAGYTHVTKASFPSYSRHVPRKGSKRICASPSARGYYRAGQPPTAS